MFVLADLLPAKPVSCSNNLPHSSPENPMPSADMNETSAATEMPGGAESSALTEANTPGEAKMAPKADAEEDVFYPTVGMPPQVQPRPKYSTLPRSFRQSRRLSREMSNPESTAKPEGPKSPEERLQDEIFSMINNSTIASSTEQILNRRYSQLSDDGNFFEGTVSPRQRSSRSSSMKDKRRSSWAFGGSRRNSKAADFEQEDEVPEMTEQNQKAMKVLGLGPHHRRESMHFFDRDAVSPSESPPAEARKRKVSLFNKDAAKDEKIGRHKRSRSKRLLGAANPKSPISEQAEDMHAAPSVSSLSSLRVGEENASADQTLAQPLWAHPSPVTRSRLARSKSSEMVLDNDKGPEASLRRPRKQSLPSEASGFPEAQSLSPASSLDLRNSLGTTIPEPLALDSSPTVRRLNEAPDLMVVPPTPVAKTVTEEADDQPKARARSKHVSSKTAPGLKSVMGKLRRTIGGGRKRAHTTGAVKINTKPGKVDTNYETVPSANTSHEPSLSSSPFGSNQDIAGDKGWHSQSVSVDPGGRRMSPLSESLFAANRPRSFTFAERTRAQSMSPTASLPRDLPLSSNTLPPASMSLASPVGGLLLGSSFGSDVFLARHSLEAQDSGSLSTISAATNEDLEVHVEHEEDEAEAEAAAPTSVLYV